jgi:hypothetical protein
VLNSKETVVAVYFASNDPAGLLKAFDARIHQKEASGKITTWEKMDDGVHYSHKADDWKRKAFFKPKIEPGKLTFNLIRPQKKSVNAVVYGYYHGHLIETFLNHFDKLFASGTATALPAPGDDINEPT